MQTQDIQNMPNCRRLRVIGSEEETWISNWETFVSMTFTLDDVHVDEIPDVQDYYVAPTPHFNPIRS